ncbi:DUF1501 domain-containing protein [Caulobacter sp. NIBR2454]|uniref:DUF1501 domain-containing protein n=1 Tax=Caulobacter sp. NIBR2454 TaxID=3015996 RepID=UPI0022B63D66|nr:DUF1501 domain-containing protein [Caulobacter sp. NIBR2454]
MTKETSRREFMRLSAGFSILGAGAPFALQLAAAGSAAAQSAGDYKALICIFLAGGQDSNNMVLATDPGSWERYNKARNTGNQPIALKAAGTAPNLSAGRATPARWGGVLPITPATPQLVPGSANEELRTFALHPMLSPLIPMFQPPLALEGGVQEPARLAVLANVGTLITQGTTREAYERRTVEIPRQLFSHNDQQSSWQSGATEGAQSGWGGRLADMVRGMNSKTVFTAISAAGNAVYLTGEHINQYAVSTSGSPGVSLKFDLRDNSTLFGSRAAATAAKNVIRAGGTSSISQVYADVVGRSMSAANDINAGVRAVAAPPAYTNPIDPYGAGNPLTPQIQTVLRIIAGAQAMGIKRQVFFVQLGGFDTHYNQNSAEPENLARLAHSLQYLDLALKNVNGVDMRANVTAFTASDFSRTFATNGSGTDHAWGGHHFIWGGAVNGGDMFGQYPTLGLDDASKSFRNPNMTDGHMIPTTSVDQYGATLGRWFGVDGSNLATVFPNLANFNQSTHDLGFMKSGAPASRG